MIRWGIIGWGNIAERFAKSLSNSKQGVLYACASKTGQKRKCFSEQYPHSKIYEDYTCLLKDANIDAVYIALPHKYHEQWSILSMKHKKAVLCEKPLGLNYDQVKNMVDYAKQANIFFMEAFKTPFIPMIKIIKEELAAGIIGKICKVEANFCVDVLKEQGPSSYLLDEEQGGALLDVGPYPVGFILDMLSYRPIKTVQCKMQLQSGIDLNFYSHITFSDGIQAIAEGSINYSKERTAIITGTKGVMTVPIYNRPQSYTVCYKDGKKSTRAEPIIVDDMFGEIEEVHNCLAKGLKQSPTMGYGHSIYLMQTLGEISRMGLKDA